jgi:hypothetical protein
MAARRREARHRAHDRRLRRDGAAAQVIAIGKPAGNPHEVEARGQVGLLVPDHLGLETGGAEGHGEITVAIRSGEDEDGGFHEWVSFGLRRRNR